MDVIIATLMVVTMITCSSLDFDEFEVLYYVIFSLPLIFNIYQRELVLFLVANFGFFSILANAHFFLCMCPRTSTSSLLGNTKVGFLNLL